MRRILLLACLLVGLATQAFAQTSVRLGASTYVQSTQPNVSNMNLGDMWYNTGVNQLNILVNAAPVTWVQLNTAAAAGVPMVSSLPATCLVGLTTYLTAGSTGVYVCTATNVWTLSGGGGGTTIPAGMIAMILSGSCASGWSEVSSLNGKMLRGTVAANGNVGTAGGSDTYTPAGTVAAPVVSWPAGVPSFAGASGTVPAQTFTGSSVTTSAVSAGTPAGTNGTVAFTPAGTNAAITAGTPAGTISALTTGADSSTTGGVAKAVAQTPTFTGAALATHTHVFTGSAGTVPAEVFTGSALATHSHTVTATGSNGTVNFTPTGTIAWPAGVPTNTAPAFAGTQATVVPAYVNVIFCSKS